MREYNGPVPTPPLPASREKRGWVELTEEDPCPECGELLIAPYTTKTTLGGREFTSYGKGQCRNSCETSAV